jgi:hypothetical protein
MFAGMISRDSAAVIFSQNLKLAEILRKACSFAPLVGKAGWA